jgi:hypothetical protein
LNGSTPPATKQELEKPKVKQDELSKEEEKKIQEKLDSEETLKKASDLEKFKQASPSRVEKKQ